MISGFNFTMWMISNILDLLILLQARYLNDLFLNIEYLFYIYNIFEWLIFEYWILFLNIDIWMTYFFALYTTYVVYYSVFIYHKCGIVYHICSILYNKCSIVYHIYGIQFYDIFRLNLEKNLEDSNNINNSWMYAMVCNIKIRNN